MLKKKNACWMVLAAVIIIRGIAGGGLNTVSGLFLLPASMEIETGIGELSIYFSIISFVTILWLPTAGKLFNRADIRLIATGGAALMALSFAFLGLQNHVMGWYLLAIPYAMGSTLLVTLLGPILISRWFSRNTGFYIGVQMAFVGLFGALFQPVTATAIETFGWRQSYLYLGIGVFVVVLFFGVFFLQNSPEEEIATKETAASETAEDNSSRYYLLLFMITITGVAVFTQHLPVYGRILGYSLKETGTVLAFTSLGNAAGSITIGIISDRFGALKTCYSVIFLGLLTVVGLFALGHNIAMFSFLAFLFGLVTSAIMVLAPVLIMEFYGRINYEKYYAGISMGAPIASVILIPAYGFIYDFTGSYLPVLVVMAIFLILSAFYITIGWKKR